MRSIPTIRSGSAEDIPAVKQLLTGVDEAALVAIPGKRHLLVLDGDNGHLAGAALLLIDDASAHESARGHLAALAVAPELAGERLEDRFIAVIEAICEAFGVRLLDIPARTAA
jgi:N-acetylglutamate synthase-like GNAT family acetyltransferase